MVGGLFQWLSNFRLKDKGEEATHYCLVGGKFCIPEKDHAQWLAYYAEHLQVSSEPIYFVERRTPYFRMHYDLDMIQLDVPTLEDVIGMVRICNNVFRRFYPGQPEDNRFTAIILKSPTMDKTVCADGSTEQVAVQKTGFHIIWPLLLVNQVQALTMREACVVEMVRVLPPRVFPANPMEEVVDDCVLLENGLRMVGSDKAKQCDLCGGKGRVDGDNCMNCRYGRVPERRVYTPYCVLTAAGEPDEAKLRVLSREENKLPLVSCCSIRSAKTQPTPGYVKPPLVPEITPDMLLKEKKRHALQKTRAANGKAVVEGGIRWLGDATVLERDSVVFQQMQEFLQKRMGRPEWAQLQVKSFLYSSTSNRYLLKVWSEGSRWCGNVGREHSSSTIFFVVNKHGVVQKCFCKKRNFEPYCSSYASVPVKLTRTLHAVLFNEEGGESAPALPPAPLVSPIASTQPFVPTQPLPQRKRCMPDVTAQLSALPVVAPVVHQKVQLQAQQAAQRLAQAMQHRLSNSSATPAGTGKKSGGKKSMKPVSHACQPSGKLRAKDMVKLDKERATQSSGMVEQMRAEMQQSQSATRPAKKAKKA